MIPEDALTARDFMQIRAELVRAVGGANEALVVSTIHFKAHEGWHEAYERDGRWWWRATADEIAVRTGLSSDQVRRALRSLIDAGHIVGEKHRRGGISDQAYSYAIEVGEGRQIDLAESPNGDVAESPDVLLLNKGEEVTPYSPPEAHVEIARQHGKVVAQEAMTYKEVCFEAAWQSWPKKESKKPAHDKFMRLAKTSEDATRLGAAITRYAQAYVAAGREVRYLPMLSTWLNNERWNDPLPQPESNRETSHTQKNMALLAQIAREEGVEL